MELLEAAAEEFAAAQAAAEAAADARRGQELVRGRRRINPGIVHQLQGAGEARRAIAVRAPRVNDKRDDEKFFSKILPPYMRKSP